MKCPASAAPGIPVLPQLNRPCCGRVHAFGAAEARDHLVAEDGGASQAGRNTDAIVRLLCVPGDVRAVDQEIGVGWRVADVGAGEKRSDATQWLLVAEAFQDTSRSASAAGARSSVYKVAGMCGPASLASALAAWSWREPPASWVLALAVLDHQTSRVRLGGDHHQLHAAEEPAVLSAVQEPPQPRYCKWRLRLTRWPVSWILVHLQCTSDPAS